MRKVGLDDLVGLTRYSEVRDEARRRIIAVKRNRRIAVGDIVSLVFENFDTVLFQTQEMLFVERISDLDRVREELSVYNELLPRPGELSATLFVEITDPSETVERLNLLVGIDECVSLDVAGERFPATFEPGRSREDKISAVQYVRFPISPEAARRLAAPGTPVEIAIDHPHYRARARLTEEQRSALAEDLCP
jgi:hypothetical protein